MKKQKLQPIQKAKFKLGDFVRIPDLEKNYELDNPPIGRVVKSSYRFCGVSTHEEITHEVRFLKDLFNKPILPGITSGTPELDVSEDRIVRLNEKDK